MCENLKGLIAVNALRRGSKCPWIDQCRQNLSTDKCELIAACESMDPSKRSPVFIFDAKSNEQLPNAFLE